MEIFEKVDNDRILFGTDWPFFPMVLPLAKTLIALDGDDALRRKVLFSNAENLLKMHAPLAVNEAIYETVGAKN